MKISRQGAYAYRGIKEISLKEPLIQWSRIQNSILIEAFTVADFSGRSAHHYDVLLEKHELQAMLRVLALAAQEQPVNVRDVVRPELKSLMQLVALAAGISIAKETSP